MRKVLIVEDDDAVREVVEKALRGEGLRTVGARDGEEALRRLREEASPFDLVLLDLMLPGELDGFAVCRKIRAGAAGEENRGVPVIMLTVRDDEASIVAGLEVGADDYVSKPFGIRELTSRARAHLRRRRLAESASAHRPVHRLQFPGLEIDLLGRWVMAGGRKAELTPTEFDLLTLLASSPGRVYSRRQILEHLWDGRFFGAERAVDVHVRNVRRKVEPDPRNPRFLFTVRGVGYKFVAPSEERAARRARPTD